MSEPVVRIEGLKKFFGTVIALDGVSLEVERGGIFGLLGPNGAGKTTTVKILITLVRPDEGKAEVAGVDVVKNPAQARRMIGYVPQELTVDPYLTAREHLNYYADLYHLPSAARKSRIEEALALVGMAGLEDRRARHLSGGTKKKLDLACGLLHRPPVILLDEPSLGLDVQVRRDVWNHILRLKQEGTTVFLCTNYMDEAERLCDRVAIIDRGKIVALDSPAALRSRLARDVVSVEIANANGQDGAALDDLERAVSRLSMVQKSMKDGTRLKIYVESNETAVPKILEAAAAAGISVQSITYSRPGLDDVFLHYAGRPFSEGGSNGA
ncbi:MAG TPA: ATP-binding cassette domain-containing protein [Candidatus Binatia bacterium]|jgi:ABC-2 type transport system ATP-binding protein